MNEFEEMAEPRVEYQADILIDGEIKGSIQSYTMEGLQEQLRKLEHIEKKFNFGDYDDKRYWIYRQI